MNTIVNSKQKPRNSNREHALNLIGLLNEVEVNRNVTDTFTQVDIIME